MNLKSFQCKGCYYFKKGKCLCYIRKEGPRGTKDCPSCRCVVISYILGQKKHTQKIFYHLRLVKKGRKCGCILKCKLRNDNLPCQRVGPKGKSAFVFHQTCAPGYKKCRQMRKLEKNLEKFTKLVENHGKLEIPAKCVPFLGTKQRHYSEYFSNESHIKCLKNRKTVAEKTKKKLAWSKRNMEKVDFLAHISSSSSDSDSQNMEKVDFFAHISSSSSDSDSQDSQNFDNQSTMQISEEETDISVSTVENANSSSSEYVHLFADIPELTPIGMSDLMESSQSVSEIQSTKSHPDGREELREIDRVQSPNGTEYENFETSPAPRASPESAIEISAEKGDSSKNLEYMTGLLHFFQNSLGKTTAKVVVIIFMYSQILRT